MTSKFLRSVLAIAVFSMISAWAQTGGAAAAPTGAAGSPATASSPVPTSSGTKLGTINIEQAVLATNEGQRDFEALSKKLEPKRNELKGQSDELEGLQKQLQTQGDKLNEDARAALVKQIETKKKALDRAAQDFQEDGQNQQREMFQRILQKMGQPVIIKYAQDNGFSMIVDTSNPWPQSPVLWATEGVDITKAVVDIYNAQSGVPAPAAAGGAAKPATPKPAAPKPPAPKPAAPKTNEPPK
ncbi:MAG TPA: OmpH family outer membrane protein [Candidatus Acidoferrum sp.]|jgi:outer membrane protein|nr:OmpH family outer membrane protein [Candidatus Acidoferrum sp.]